MIKLGLKCLILIDNNLSHGCKIPLCLEKAANRDTVQSVVWVDGTEQKIDSFQSTNKEWINITWNQHQLPPTPIVATAMHIKETNTSTYVTPESLHSQHTFTNNCYNAGLCIRKINDNRHYNYFCGFFIAALLHAIIKNNVFTKHLQKHKI